MHIKPVRYQNQRCLHFITFSCYRRMKLLDGAPARDAFEVELERVRRWYGCYLTGYVVMPEHVHLLMSEPERGKLSLVIQMLKQITSRKLRPSEQPILAGALLRFSRVDGGETDREAALYPPQPGVPWIGAAAGRLEVEQLQALCDGHGRHGRD